MKKKMLIASAVLVAVVLTFLAFANTFAFQAALMFIMIFTPFLVVQSDSFFGLKVNKTFKNICRVIIILYFIFLVVVLFLLALSKNN